jgi:hypothetical protein
MQATQARVLECNKLIDVNEVIAKCHLMLLLSLVEVTIDHLKNSVLRIDLSVVVLLVDLHLLLQLLGLGHSHDLTPVS